ELLGVEALDDNVFGLHSPSGEYVLKVMHRRALLSHQRYEFWLIKALRRQNISFYLPMPILDTQGEAFHQRENGDVWVLTRRFYGEHIVPGNVDHAYVVGAALSEFHRAAQSLPPLLRPDYLEYSLKQRTLPHIRAPLPTDVAQLGLQATPEGQHRLERFRRLARQFTTAPPLPHNALLWHITHGDFFGEHLLYDGDRITAVLDFKHAHPDYRAREFAETLLRVGGDLTPIFWGTARAFVEGYAEHAALTDVEIHLVPRFMVETQVERILYYGHSGQPAHAARALRGQEEISAWLEVEESRLIAMLRGTFLGE
ncbi:MAG: phosphotransferase, partial [Anaerolineales bacterium]